VKTGRLVCSKMPKEKGVDEPTVGFMPMPAVMISCISKEGRPNIIPIIAWSFSCRYPPKITIGICEGDYTPSYYVRASYQMIRDTREFVINFPDTSMRDQITLTGKLTANDPAVDKFKAAGLTPGRSLVVKAPTIEECPISIECVVREELSLGSHHLFVGEIVAYHEPGQIVRQENQEELDTILYQPAGGGPRMLLTWCSLPTFTEERPSP
jgi:flavin reductase (DIM6/NTAB) family NADH-FMN oxidoreductase RutF